MSTLMMQMVVAVLVAWLINEIGATGGRKKNPRSAGFFTS